jgi:hypothetical protein
LQLISVDAEFQSLDSSKYLLGATRPVIPRFAMIDLEALLLFHGM